MAVVSGLTSHRVPLDRCPATPRPSVALAGATRRCFALLGAFPARRDEALRGALGVGGGVRVGQSVGWAEVAYVGDRALCSATGRCSDLLWSDPHCCLVLW